MIKTLWILAVHTGVSVELHAIYATDQADARRQSKEKEHSGTHIDLRECSNGFTLYRLVLPGQIEVSEVKVPFYFSFGVM